MVAVDESTVHSTTALRTTGWRLNYAALLLAQLVSSATFASINPFLPLYLIDLGENQASVIVWVGAISAGSNILQLFANPFWGVIADRFGRKAMVYVSGAFMAVVGAAFVFAPYLVPGNLLLLAYVAAAIFGLGYGAYVSVDWALVADVLPDENTYARDMGVWNIGLTLPQVIATVLGAWFIALGTALVSQQFGYTLLFVWFVIFCVLGTVTVRFIRGVK